MYRRDGYKNAVGFDKNVKTLRKMLLRKDNHQLMFISIFGDSGTGKSTLAEVIYHKKMMRRFALTACVTMPPDCNTESLLQKFLLQGIYDEMAEDCVKEENTDCSQPEKSSDVSNAIRRVLANQRYLVILSGISSKTMLNCMRASLPDDNNGSTVVLILDTESEEVVWHANSMNKGGTNGIHRLSRLDEERSGELFCSRAFRKQPSDEGKEDKNKYDRIVFEITGVYRLAIVVLAGLVRFKEKPLQWEVVLQQLRPGP